MILFIDNYDSFVHNLARYFQRLQQNVSVVRNDQISIDEIEQLSPDAIVISPGPCGPVQAGVSLEVVREFQASIPILGVCLGHQVIAEAFGGKIVRANHPMHGRASTMRHCAEGVFADIANPFDACRYHSLVVDRKSLPDCLRVTAETADGTIMAIRHHSRPIIGLQFHPESILTQNGYQLAANFLRLSSIPIPGSIPSTTSELCRPANRKHKSVSTTIWNPENLRDGVRVGIQGDAGGGES